MRGDQATTNQDIKTVNPVNNRTGDANSSYHKVDINDLLSRAR